MNTQQILALVIILWTQETSAWAEGLSQRNFSGLTTTHSHRSSLTFFQDDSWVFRKRGGPCCLSWLAKRKPPHCPWLPLLLSPAARRGEAGFPFQGQRGTRCWRCRAGNQGGSYCRCHSRAISRGRPGSQAGCPRYSPRAPPPCPGESVAFTFHVCAARSASAHGAGDGSERHHGYSPPCPSFHRWVSDEPHSLRLAASPLVPRRPHLSSRQPPRSSRQDKPRPDHILTGGQFCSGWDPMQHETGLASNLEKTSGCGNEKQMPRQTKGRDGQCGRRVTEPAADWTRRVRRGGRTGGSCWKERGRSPADARKKPSSSFAHSSFNLPRVSSSILTSPHTPWFFSGF